MNSYEIQLLLFLSHFDCSACSVPFPAFVWICFISDYKKIIKKKMFSVFFLINFKNKSLR